MPWTLVLLFHLDLFFFATDMISELKSFIALAIKYK